MQIYFQIPRGLKNITITVYKQKHICNPGQNIQSTRQPELAINKNFPGDIGDTLKTAKMDQFVQHPEEFVAW